MYPSFPNEALEVDEIDSRSQFHQHFTHAFFKRKCFKQLFSSYGMSLVKGLRQKKPFGTKNASVKKGNTSLDICGKMLMRLTIEITSPRFILNKTRMDDILG